MHEQTLIDLLRLMKGVERKLRQVLEDEKARPSLGWRDRVVESLKDPLHK